MIHPRQSAVRCRSLSERQPRSRNRSVRRIRSRISIDLAGSADDVGGWSTAGSVDWSVAVGGRPVVGGVHRQHDRRAGSVRTDRIERGLNRRLENRSARRDSQVRPTAQRSGRCLVGVRRFKSCSLHDFCAIDAAVPGVTSGQCVLTNIDSSAAHRDSSRTIRASDGRTTGEDGGRTVRKDGGRTTQIDDIHTTPRNGGHATQQDETGTGCTCDCDYGVNYDTE